LTVDDRIDGPCDGFVFTLEPDLNRSLIQGIEAHFDGASGQMRRRFVEAVAQQEGGIFAHQTIEAMEEETAQIGGGRELPDVLDIALPARQGCGSEGAVLGAVIDGFNPRPETIVQFLKKKGMFGIQVGQELRA
jgi:hypothetical protein